MTGRRKRHQFRDLMLPIYPRPTWRSPIARIRWYGTRRQARRQFDLEMAGVDPYTGIFAACSRDALTAAIDSQLRHGRN